MKRIIAILMAAVMLLSLAACGGKDNTPPDNTDKPANTDTSTTAPTPGTGDKEDEGKATAGGGDVKSVITQYGSNPDYEAYTATIYCPDGAYFDEDEYAEFQADGYINDFWVYDDVREYNAYSTVYWSRDIYKEGDELPLNWGIVEQLYFEGEAAPETAAEYPEHDQKVTDLGFKWNGLDVKLIETTYASDGDSSYHEEFVGVEYTHYFWVVEEGTGKVTDGVTAPGLFGFSISGWDITVDQYAWIAGQLFGVDSGRTWPLEGEGEATGTPVVNVNAAELLGTWLQRDSDWEDTYIFNADGSGMLISGPEYPYTYEVSGDILTLDYGDGDEDEFTISVDGDLLTMSDKWGDELLLDKQAEDVSEPESNETEVPVGDPGNPYVTEILGTWDVQDSDYLEVFTFNADGTGLYSYTDGTVYEFAYTYSFYNGDYVEIIYEDGTEDGFTIRIEGDTMYASNLSVVDMPMIRR